MTIFNPQECRKPPRADMFLPDFLKYFGFFLDAAAVAFLAGAFITRNYALLIVTLIAGALGVAAWLCWKNQTIQIVDSNHFAYTTFLGKTTVYRFSDITGMKVNSDSMTLLLTNGKVHIESMVCMSQALYEKIEAALDRE